MKYVATVAILTYNGEAYLTDALEALTRQKRVAAYEVLVIDSGSSDSTLEIVARYVAAHDFFRLHTIPNSEFGHGVTRNLAARLAEGEFVAYLTHDAIPADDEWLYELLKPFSLSDRVVAVTGRQIPRAHCVPMQKYEINALFGHFGPEFGTTLFYQDGFIQDRATFNATRFYSDVNSAARRDVLLGAIPYRDVPYSEDQLFGEDVITAGHVKAYAPRGAVIHSNDLKLSEYRQRLFEETRGLRNIGTPIDTPSLRFVAGKIAKGSAKDSVRILRDRDYTTMRKLRWLALNPLFHIAKWRGVRQALATPPKPAQSANIAREAGVSGPRTREH